MFIKKTEACQFLTGHLSAWLFKLSFVYLTCIKKYNRSFTMKIIQVTQEEINQATRPNVYKNKKKYTRKKKHKGKSE